MPCTSLFPSQSNLYCSLVRSRIDLCTGNAVFFAALINCSFHHPNFSPFQGATAPSYTLAVLLGITRSSSIPKTWLNPSHTGQAPNGLLNENKFGTGSSNCIPSNSNLLLKCRSSFAL